MIDPKTSAKVEAFDIDVLRTRARREEHEQHFYLRMLKQHVRPGMRWLDAGCGHSLIPSWLSGRHVIEQGFLHEASIIVGADVDVPSLSVACSIERVACQLERIAFASSTFDLITCNMVVEHLSNPGRVFEEFGRVLRPGGIVIILTPNMYHWVNIVSMLTPFWVHRWMLKHWFSQEPQDVFPTLYRCNTKRAMQRQLLPLGFQSLMVYMVPGRQRLIDFGPLFYLEYLFYQLSIRCTQLREILCVVAQKSDGALASKL